MAAARDGCTDERVGRAEGRIADERTPTLRTQDPHHEDPGRSEAADRGPERRSGARADDDGARLRALRVAGGVRLSVSRGAQGDRVDRLREQGGYRIRVQRGEDRAAGVEALLINTGGGVAAGDRARLEFVAAPDAALRVSAPAAERVYGADPALDVGPAQIDLALRAEAGARLIWMPQETILFDRPDLRRRVTLDAAGSARALIVETLTLGRAAMGETVAQGRIRDRWRVRRDGALAFADSLALTGSIAEKLRAPAAAGGRRVFGAALLAAPDAAARLEAARAVLTPWAQDGGLAAASAWNGLLLVRALHVSTAPVLQLWAMLSTTLSDLAPPRAWPT